MGNDPMFDHDLNRIYDARPAGLMMAGHEFESLVQRVFQTLDGHVRACHSKQSEIELGQVASGAAESESDAWLSIRIVRSSFAIVTVDDDVVAEFATRYADISPVDVDGHIGIGLTVRDPGHLFAFFATDEETAEWNGVAALSWPRRVNASAAGDICAAHNPAVTTVRRDFLARML